MVINPNVAVGSLELNFTKSACERVLGIATESFKRTDDSTATVLVYDQDSIYVTIDKDENVIEYSLFAPLQVYLKGIQLLGRKANEVYSQLQDAGLIFEPNDVGMESLEFGVNLVEIEEIIDCVEVFSEQKA